MSPKVITPTVEQTLAQFAERIRHLEAADKYQFGEVRNAKHFAVGSATGGVQEAYDNLPATGGKVFLPRGSPTCPGQVTLTNKPLVLEGSGWDSILNYTGNADFFTLAGGFQYGQAVFRNFRINGNVNAGHCFRIGATSDVWNPVWDGMFINGFSKVGSAGIYGENFYNATIKGDTLILDCYDGMFFGSESMTCEIKDFWIRGFQRYGVAVVTTAGIYECFNIHIHDGIIDEATGAAAKEGVYINKGHLVEVDHIHFEGITTGVHIANGINNAIRQNFFAADLTNAFVLDAAASGTVVGPNNRYLGGVAKVDNGTRTVFVFDDQYATEGDGGAANSRTSWGTRSTYPGWLVQKAGYGIHLLGRRLAGYSMITPNSIHSLVDPIATPVITTSDIIDMSGTGARNVDGFSAASSVAGRRVIVYFSDSNITLRHNQAVPHPFRLDGGVNWNPAVNDSITLVCIDDGTWLEVGRVDIS